MHEENLLRLDLEATQPVKQSRLIRMTGKSLKVVNLCLYENRLIKQAHFLRALDQRSAKCAFRLITDEYNAVSAVPKVVFQMVTNSSRFAHAAGGNDDFWMLVHIQHL